MAKRSKQDASAASTAEMPRESPFAKLAAQRADLPPGPTASTPTSHASQSPAEPKGPARAVVRYERKGHGGKEATRIEQLDLSRTQLEAWMKELKRALGCGGAVDGATLLVQGDQRERVRAWLEKRGVRRVTVS